LPSPRLVFWTDVVGEMDVATITPDDIDAALVKFAERGRLIGARGSPPQQESRWLAPR